MEPLIETVAGCLARQGAIGDARVAVACSGGVDSLALAALVADLAALDRIPSATVLHVDHGLQPGSADVAAAVGERAAGLGLGFHLERAEVDGAASLEDAARRARYAAFERAAAARGFDAILIAHTADDQAETVLHRILRGTGLAGLAGMGERRGRYLRPLLGRRRAELGDYLRQRGLTAIEDPMNVDPRFARVRIRRELLPALRRENPQVDAALARLAAQAAEGREAIEWAADRLIAAARAAAEASSGDTDDLGPEAPLSVAALAAAPSSVVRAALIGVAAAAGVGPLAAVHLEALERLVRAPIGGAHAIDLPAGRAVREYDGLRLERRADPHAPTRARSVTITVSGPGGPYVVRPWRPGDRMRPARLGGRSRKLSDLYGDLRVPRTARATAQVVTDGSGTIVWAQHIGQAWKCPVEVCLTGVEPVASNKN